MSRQTAGRQLSHTRYPRETRTQHAFRPINIVRRADLIIGTGRSAIGTIVERTSRYTLLVHLPRLEGNGVEPPTKNGPALGGYGAIAMTDALQATLGSMPEGLVRSLTWDSHTVRSVGVGWV